MHVFIYTFIHLHINILKPSQCLNSETTFLYQLFKENSNFIVEKPCKDIYLSAFYDVFVFLFIYRYIYTPSNQHFKAFPVSKINSETSFLYQFQGEFRFDSVKFMYLFRYVHLQIIILKPSRYLKSIPRQVFCINFQGQFKFYSFKHSK